MSDPYLYESSTVLRNKLDILDEKVLDLVEAEQSRAKMMILYKKGFQDFSPGTPLSTTSRSAFQASGRSIRSVKETPGQSS